MATAKSKTVADVEPESVREIRNERVFAAPPERVFLAWSTPQHIARWWGPNGFRTTIHSMEFRPGGDWRLTLHGPDGTDYPNHSRFVEIDASRRIVIDHLSAPHFRMTATFEPVDPGQTRLKIQMLFDSAAELQRVNAKFQATEGNKQMLVRLEAFLLTLPR